MMTSTNRTRAFRARRKEQGLPAYDREKHREYKRFAKAWAIKPERAFVGCDGEGCGTDEKGRQLYMLFRMGKRELFTGHRLTTEELLDFICDSPRSGLYVGFAFGYDVTMILRDLSESRSYHLMGYVWDKEKSKYIKRNNVFGPGISRFTWYKNFNIEYLPRQYFKVCRVKIERREDGTEKRTIIKGSTRIIYETFGFFQKSFVKVINEFSIGTEAERISVAIDKERRSSFERISEKERAYCALECRFLAELMEKLRGYCNDANIKPSTWNGAGKLASALHKLHETPNTSSLDIISPGVLDYANMAYYGGRFEITRTGNIKEKVYEYDIHSAYPAAMRDLPCLLHGTWEEMDAKRLRDLARRENDNLFVASCSFKAARDAGATGPAGTVLGGLPVRSKEGHLYWPSQGGGIYWSVEIASARRLGFSISYKSGWAFKRNCDCRLFQWVEELYEYRKSIGGSGPGYPIKLGINSLYGKLAQRKGNGTYNNMIWAGLITARTRAKLNEAISYDPNNVVMLATDAIYSLNPITALVCSDRLGDWEAAALDGLFIVQPGLYWCPAKRKRKSRGLSGKFFETPGLTESFEDVWRYFQAQENSKLVTDFPSVKVPVTNFIGLKLAHSWGKLEKAGCWEQTERIISFDYRNKRQGHVWEGEAIRTKIKPGYPGLVSLPHRDFLAAGGQEPWENARLMLEEQPDYVDLGIPFKD